MNNENINFETQKEKEDRSKWTVQQWTDYAKAGNKDLKGANLEGANLDGVDLNSADLRDANLRGADLEGATLDSADLRGADLREAYLEGAHLVEADLREAILYEYEGWDCVNKADLFLANIASANIDGQDEKQLRKQVAGF